MAIQDEVGRVKATDDLQFPLQKLEEYVDHLMKFLVRLYSPLRQGIS